MLTAVTAEASRESKSESSVSLADALDVAISYYRKELDLYQARIDRAETQAAGLITAALTVGALATTLLAAFKLPLGAGAIALVVAGAIGLIAAILWAFGSRDTQTNVSAWFKRLAPKRLVDHTTSLLELRRSFDRAVEDLEDTVEPGFPTRQVIAPSLRSRIKFAREIARWRERHVRIAALCLVSASAVLLLAAVLAATGI